MKKHVATMLLLAPILYAQPASARWSALSECNSYAQEVNTQLPMQLDAATIWTNAICIGAGAGVLARYSYTLLIPESQAYPRRVKETVYQGLINSWCTDPTLRDFLQNVDVEAIYSLQNGKFITSLRVSKDMC